MSDSHTSHYSVYHHLAAQKVEFYRALLGVFVEAKERFEIALRPGEVLTRLTRTPAFATLELEELSAGLEALRDWGNLSATKDMVSARTVEEFLRPRNLYQLSARGESAERALHHYEGLLLRPGELSASALREIGDTLEELRLLLESPVPDLPKAVRALAELSRCFERLVDRAQAFIGGLQRELDSASSEEQAVLALKEELLGYLERFVRELVASSYRIRQALRSIDTFDLRPLLEALVNAELADVLTPSDQQRAQAFHLWQNRWEGLRHWFIGTAEEPSMAEALRSRALSAIPALLERIRRINDQRANRSDLASDFVALAQAFATAPDNRDLHRLWRSAFGLSSSRHLRINEATLRAWDNAECDTRLSWEEAPPYVISISQWARGQAMPRGTAPGLVDRSVAHAGLRLKAELERQRLRQARARIASLTPCRLSDLGPLNDPEFDVLLDAIGEAFTRLVPGALHGTAITEDGEMQVRLSIPAPSAAQACVETLRGTLKGPDMVITLRLLNENLSMEDSAALSTPQSFENVSATLDLSKGLA